MSFGFGFALPAYPLRGGGGNNPFNQLGPTLDLSFAGVVTDQSDPNGYTLNTNFIIPQYQIAAQYVVWENGVGLVDKTFSQIITFTRASTATFTGSNGLIQSAAIDAPRFDFDPVTLAARGILIEEQRTNLLTYSEDFSNAAWLKAGTGTASAPVVTANAATAPDGATSADLIVFNRGAGNTLTDHSYMSQSPSVTSGAHTQTVWLKAASPGDVGKQLALRNVGGANYLTVTLTADWVRYTRTETGASPTFEIANRGTFTADNSVSAYVWGAQLEAGSFATSYIPTVASQVTRSADAASVNTLSPWYNAAEGTLFVQATSSVPDSDAIVRFAAALFETGSYANAVRLERLGGVARDVQTVGGSSNVVTALWSAGNTVAIAGAYKNSNSAASFNGAAVQDIAGNVPTGIATLGIGGGVSGSNSLCGHIRRITYYPRRLSNAELQAITA